MSTPTPSTLEPNGQAGEVGAWGSILTYFPSEVVAGHLVYTVDNDVQYSIKVNTSTNEWFDHGDSTPGTVSEDPSTGVVTLRVGPGGTIKYKFKKPIATSTTYVVGGTTYTIPAASWLSSGGGSGSGSGSTYPPPRTTRFVSAVAAGVSWAWSTYQVYQTASGGNPVGGAGGGGWIYNLVQGETANEVTAEIEVGANNPNGANVSAGDELYLEFDGHHDDVSETPNMTITSEVIDTSGTTTNPSNTVDNTVTSGSSGTTVYIKIQCVRKPKGVIRLYIKEPDPNNEGVAPTFVDEVILVKSKPVSRNFW